MEDTNVHIEFSWNSEEHYLLVAECQQTNTNEFDVTVIVSGCNITFWTLTVDSLDELYKKCFAWFRNARFL